MNNTSSKMEAEKCPNSQIAVLVVSVPIMKGWYSQASTNQVVGSDPRLAANLAVGVVAGGFT